MVRLGGLGPMFADAGCLAPLDNLPFAKGARDRTPGFGAMTFLDDERFLPRGRKAYPRAEAP
jgi:hypothetical protein